MIGPANAFSQQLHAVRRRGPRFKGDIRRQRFSEQQFNARRRGVPWRLTFDQWWAVWEASGRWPERGRARGQFCLSRVGDAGAYEVGNVFVQRRDDNDRQRKANGTARGPAKGSCPPSAKLTGLEVQAILACLACGVPGRTLARIFRIRETTISAIKHGQNWKGVAG